MSARRLMLVAVLSLVTAVATGGCTEPPTKIAIGVVAYVGPDDPLFTDVLLKPGVPLPEYVVVNLSNGDPDPMNRMPQLDEKIRWLHLRGPVKVLGYVWTSDLNRRNPDGSYDFSNRSEDDIKASVDRWLVRPDGQVHYDGIFFDVASPICAHRDKFLRLRKYVQSLSKPAIVVHNPGVPVHKCYLEPGKETADIFGTFEGSEAVYHGEVPPGYGSWLGGNVSLAPVNEYVKGDVLTFTDERGTTVKGGLGPDHFWHLIYGAHAERVQENVTTARSRGAGVLTISTMPGPVPNPWVKGANDPADFCALLTAAAGTTAPATTPAPCGRVPVPVS